jgi:putative cardiolipin synthase
MVTGDWPLQWSANYQFISDDPLKVTMTKRDAQRTQVGSTLVPMVQAAQTQLSVISPYFVPGDGVTKLFTTAAGAGTQVRVLTNSLAANDVAAVHGGYSRYRKPLLGAACNCGSSSRPQAKWSRACSDRRGESAHQGVRRGWQDVVRGQLQSGSTLDVAELRNRVCSWKMLCWPVQLEEIFARQTAGEHAWQVTLEQRSLHWTDGREHFDSDPRHRLRAAFRRG